MKEIMLERDDWNDISSVPHPANIERTTSKAAVISPERLETILYGLLVAAAATATFGPMALDPFRTLTSFDDRINFGAESGAEELLRNGIDVKGAWNTTLVGVWEPFAILVKQAALAALPGMRMENAISALAVGLHAVNSVLGAPRLPHD